MAAPSNGQVLTWNTALVPPGPNWATGGGGGGGVPATAFFGIYVSKAGSDITGDGSISNPYLTIQTAVTSAGAPSTSNIAVVTILDVGPYDENITIANPNILIYGPNTILLATAGDALTFSFTSGFTRVSLFDCTASAGNAINIINGATVVFDASIIGGASVTVNNGGLFFSCDVGTFSPTTSGSGRIFGNCSDFTGTPTGSNISILDPRGTSATSFTAKEFIAPAPTPAAGSLVLQPSNNTANVVTTMTNQPTSVAMIHSLPNLAFSNVTLLATRLAQTDPNSNLIWFDTDVDASFLVGGSSFSIASTYFGGQYRVRELYINSQGVNFSGGGGDRNLQIDDGLTIYSVIPAATLQSLVNNRWGSTDLPFPATASINTLTFPSFNLSVRYNGGTTDYTTGTITISGVWEKVV